jgi:hypothetical protein
MPLARQLLLSWGSIDLVRTTDQGASRMISRFSAVSAGILMSLCALAQGAQVAETFRTNLDPLIDGRKLEVAGRLGS